jgi:hypothetical protein
LLLALSDVAARLEPKEAERYLDKAATELLKRKPGANDLTQETLLKVISRMESKHAAPYVKRAAGRILQLISPEYGWEMQSRLDRDSAMIASLMDRKDGASFYFHVVARRPFGFGFGLWQILNRAELPLGSALNGYGSYGSYPDRFLFGFGKTHCLAALLALEPLPNPLPAQVLVDLLKQPTCVGLARRAVLDALGTRYSRNFTDQWDFVDYAEEQELGLDLTSPPKQPEVLDR